ncbi:hypothetical protein ACN24K_29440 [Streptomyces microflavus]
MTYDAEDDTSPPMLPARSRHASVWSGTPPGLGSAAPHVAELDPAPRRRT